MANHFPPRERLYSTSHGWLALRPLEQLSDYPIRVGLTEVGLGPSRIAGVELPSVRSTIEAGVPCGTIRTDNGAAIEIYAPISGLVTLTNITVIDYPETVSEDPYHRGWLFAVLPTATSSIGSLLTSDQYWGHLRASA